MVSLLASCGLQCLCPGYARISEKVTIHPLFHFSKLYQAALSHQGGSDPDFLPFFLALCLYLLSIYSPGQLSELHHLPLMCQNNLIAFRSFPHFDLSFSMDILPFSFFSPRSPFLLSCRSSRLISPLFTSSYSLRFSLYRLKTQLYITKPSISESGGGNGEQVCSFSKCCVVVKTSLIVHV